MSEPYLPADTTLEAIRVVHAAHRRMPAERRLRMAFQMTAAARAVSEAGVRARHPDYSDGEVKRAVLELMLGEELFRRAQPTGESPMTPEEFVLLMTERFQAAGIPFMVTGSHSSSYHSEPRTTQDADFVIDPTSEQLEYFLASLGDDFYVSAESAREALARRYMFNVVHLDSGWKADLIVRKDRPFSVEEFGRRQTGKLYGREMPIASAEDVILTKLEWDKITTSERQVRDALNVAVVRWPTLDQSYLRHWAAELGVSEKLEELLHHAEQQRP